MTKAERIFRATYTECRIHAKNWGFQYNPDGRPAGYSSMICKDTESVCIRTLNEIQKCIDREHKNIERDEKLGISTKERLYLLRYALEMVQVTADNNRKRIRDFQRELASCGHC